MFHLRKAADTRSHRNRVFSLLEKFQLLQIYEIIGTAEASVSCAVIPYNKCSLSRTWHIFLKISPTQMKVASILSAYFFPHNHAWRLARSNETGVSYCRKVY